MVARYGVGYKPSSYYNIRDKLLKRAVEKTDVMLQEFRDEGKRTEEEEDRTKAPSIIPFNDSMVARGVPAMAAVAIAALDLTGSSNWWRDINRSPLWQD
ncbi:hypothetical protein JHK82_022558 [Glycine max]|nr:hypothetical protein JHK86_022575 [Glycine max]KAG5137827.1 hypothetical protein JHK82_022558 [Glycine max]